MNRRHILALGIAALATAGIAAMGQGQGAPAAAPAQAVRVEVPLPPEAKARVLLPEAFDGWLRQGESTVLLDPAQADAANGAALKEYGFSFGALAHYKRDNETLTLRALRFPDASGAFGTYSFYRHDNWARADIGTAAASDHNRVVFWLGNTVVDAQFSQIGPMTAGSLRELARRLPTPAGNKALTPPILETLPKAALNKATLHYAVGPTGYAGAGGVLPPALVGFENDAEAVTANYALTSGPATLTLISYPTPQMAEAEEAKIRAYIQAGPKAQPAFPKPLADSDQASLGVRRSGPVVAILSGDAIPNESRRLLDTVHYEDNLTSVPQPVESEVNKTGRLLFGIAALVVVGGSAALLLGFFLGGGRALYRVARGKQASTVNDAEFIRLDLEK